MQRHATTRSGSSSLLLLAIGLVFSPPMAVLATEHDKSVEITTTLEPAQLVIEAGTTVTWRNADTERHRVRSKDGPARFDSKNLESGESFSFTFAAEGSYPYYDHRDRDNAAYFGTIIVGTVGLDPDAPLPESGDVSIINKSFRPASLAIATGGTVEWGNDDGETHTVTATDQAFDSGIMSGGATFSQTFAEPGSYAYFCLIHPEMRGTVTVTDPRDDLVAGDSGTPSEDPEPVPEAGADADAIAAPRLEDAIGAIDTSTMTVSAVGRSFEPAVIEVAVGDTVAWSNDDTEGHTVTALDGSFNSGVMTVGDEFSTEFETVGTYDYFCAIHPEMTGTVTVSDAESTGTESD